MVIKKYSSPNRYKDRKGYTPDMIVLHNTGGTKISSAHYWFLDLVSQVSAHYIVGLDGEVRQYVDLKDGAWCNGTSTTKTKHTYYQNAKNPIVKSRAYNANYYTVAIECVGNTGDKLTTAQVKAVAELIKHINEELKKLYGKTIPLDTDHIIRHCDINPKNKGTCGVNVSVKEILAAMNEVEIVEVEPYVVKVTSSVSTIRKEPNADSASGGVVKKGDVYTITAEATVDKVTWGRLKSGAGWINLSHATKYNPTPEKKEENSLKAGDKVMILSTAVYGGLNSARGKKVPTKYTGSTRKYTISRIQTNNNTEEALIKELVSWVATKYLVKHPFQ